MRTLLGLTVLMLALAAAVWWKTSGDDQGDLPPNRSDDPNQGILTVGGEEGGNEPGGDPADGPAEASGNAGGDPANAGGTPEAGGSEGGEETPTPEPDGPAGGEELDPTSGVLVHEVAEGETLYRIVLNAYGTAPEDLVEAVAKANGLIDSAAIETGQPLELPSIEGYPEPAEG